MKNWIPAALVSVAVTLVSGTAYAKSTVKVHVNRVTSASAYLEGTASPKSTIKVTRHNVQYATGHVSKSGYFKFRLKKRLIAGNSYVVKATKPKYASKTIKFVCSKPKQTSSSNSQTKTIIKKIPAVPDTTAQDLAAQERQDKLAQLTEQVTKTRNANAALDSQIDQLKDKAEQYQVKIDNLSVKAGSPDVLNGKINYDWDMTNYEDGLYSAQATAKALEETKAENLDYINDLNQQILELQ